MGNTGVLPVLPNALIITLQLEPVVPSPHHPTHTLYECHGWLGFGLYWTGAWPTLPPRAINIPCLARSSLDFLCPTLVTPMTPMPFWHIVLFFTFEKEIHKCSFALVVCQRLSCSLWRSTFPTCFSSLESLTSPLCQKVRSFWEGLRVFIGCHLSRSETQSWRLLNAQSGSVCLRS